MTQYHYCRICNRGHGFHVEKKDNHHSIEAIHTDPLSLGSLCDAIHVAFSAREHADRFQTPLKKEHGSWKEVSWDTALREIASGFSKLRSEKQSAIGIGIGSDPMNRSIDFVRAMSFAVSRGFDHIFSTLSEDSGPLRMVSEWMIGHPCVPLSDLSRAHNIITMGTDPHLAGWGQLGTWYEKAIQHSRRTKKTIVSSISPDKGKFSSAIDSHIPIRPGTETIFLLGMLHMIVHNGWADKQYLHDHTQNLEHIKPYLEPWTLERCASICGIDTTTYSGLTLKFSRAAMGVIHPGVGTFHNYNSTLGAWAWLATHMATANALRPGGIYENIGAFDLYPALASLLMKDGPSQDSLPSPLLMQQSFGLLPESNINGLLMLGSLPNTMLRASVKKTIQNLKLLVVCTRQPDWVTEQADWILPSTHSLEENDVCVHRNPELPSLALPRSQALFPPFAQSKPIDTILKELSSHLSSSFSGPWGYHLNLAARPLCSLDLDVWLERLLDFGQTDALHREPGLRYQGESDRSLWRPENNTLLFSIPIIQQLFKNIHIPKTTSEYPFLLHCSGAVDDAPDDAHRKKSLETYVSVHSSSLQEGRYVLVTTHGRLEVDVRHDDGIRTDVVRAPIARIPQLMLLLPDQVAAYTGSPILDGIACRLEPLGT